MGYFPCGGLVDGDSDLEETGLTDTDYIETSEVDQQLVAQVRGHSNLDSLNDYNRKMLS
jgi:hypothetical protein